MNVLLVMTVTHLHFAPTLLVLMYAHANLAMKGMASHAHGTEVELDIFKKKRLLKQF